MECNVNVALLALPRLCARSGLGDVLGRRRGLGSGRRFSFAAGGGAAAAGSLQPGKPPSPARTHNA